ncbi:MAG: tetratricopeptide repeat protein, partial [Runella slithyformis]
MRNYLILFVLLSVCFACDTPIDQRDRFFLKGKIALTERRYNDAIKEFEEAILKDSLFADAWNNKGVALMALKQYQEAIFDYTNALQIDERAFSPRYNRSNALFELGKYEEALADLDRLIQNHKDTAYLYLSRGIILSIQKEKEKAYNDFEKAISLSGNANASASADAYINRGTILFERKEYEKAEADFRKALSIAPENDFAMSNLAVVIMEKASYQEALDLLNKAVDKRPEQALYLANRTLAKILVNDVEGAKADMKRALFYDNKSP